MSELRWHPYLEEWVAIASHRQVRPIALAPSTGPGACPFCPGGAEGLNAPYEIVTLENRFPSMSLDAQPVRRRGRSELDRRRPGRGVCEVVLYSDRHDDTLAGASRTKLYDLLRVWADRYRELGSLPGIKYVYIFENKGAVIGVTLTHPHGQIYAFPFIPPRVERELRAERRYRSRHRRCLACDWLREELHAGTRVVSVTRRFAAILPAFARYPYELHLVSRRHVGAITEFSAAELWELAAALKTVLGKYDALFGFSMPYIMLMRQRPTDGRRHPAHHFRIEFYPPHRSRDKIKYLAGCESGAGTFINDTIPEEKAAELRAVRPG